MKLKNVCVAVVALALAVGMTACGGSAPPLLHPLPRLLLPALLLLLRPRRALLPLLQRRTVLLLRLLPARPLLLRLLLLRLLPAKLLLPLQLDRIAPKFQ